jgi:predicted TIM-barrel fold metal-dependent hydrolase
MGRGAIDLWVNVSMGGSRNVDYLQRVKEDYFKGGDDFFRDLGIDECLEAMDGAGVDRAVLTVRAHRPEPHVLEFVERHPERFSLAVVPDLRKPVRDARELAALAASHPVTMARVTPFGVDLPPNHRLYYYLYARCIDLDLPVSINTGLPGPPVPGECQHPIHLDRVCYELPELRICMAHGADPWWETAIRLMIKYENLVLMTSAYAPKYFPESLIHYMNTRGRQKILFASDHPVLSMERCIREANALPLRPGVLENFLHRNAARFFWGETFDD